ncbi:MAG: hypothetical protein RDU25_00665 [Patescibacteria group bacterium]|nr:hypothetical protein [Patescibacteria group bacterium]
MLDERERAALLMEFFNCLIDAVPHDNMHIPHEPLLLPFNGSEFADVVRRLAAQRNKVAMQFMTHQGPEREYIQGLLHLRDLGYVKSRRFEPFEPEYTWRTASNYEKDPLLPEIQALAEAYLMAIRPPPTAA